nr:MAG TPA: hypothetical protein [Caudoviricetes sp.]
MVFVNVRTSSLEQIKTRRLVLKLLKRVSQFFTLIRLRPLLWRRRLLLLTRRVDEVTLV